MSTSVMDDSINLVILYFQRSVPLQLFHKTDKQNPMWQIGKRPYRKSPSRTDRQPGNCIPLGMSLGPCPVAFIILGSSDLGNSSGDEITSMPTHYRLAIGVDKASHVPYITESLIVFQAAAPKSLSGFLETVLVWGLLFIAGGTCFRVSHYQKAD